MAADASLYPFYRSNIHERRLAAVFVRAIPIIFLSVFVFLVFLGVLRHPVLLLTLCAVTNVSMWLWMTSMAVTGIVGSLAVMQAVDQAACPRARLPADAGCPSMSEDGRAAPVVDGGTPVQQAEGGEPRPAAADERVDPSADPEVQRPKDAATHVVIFPNYKEDEDMMAETLESLAECEGAANFHVVLGMEAREGEDGKLKAERLREQFKSSFAQILITSHPSNLVERHLDGSQDAEVPGKASNLKWAVREAHKELRRSAAVNLEDTLLTIADADCMFHPSYFSYISRDFVQLRRDTGSQQLWSMWQAPQLPFRNYYESPVVSRTWGYVASFYEVGGVSSLLCGGHHMVFSGYTLPLALAVDADAWDGDVMAEDHHAYLKCTFFSAWAAGRPDGGGNPLVQVRPVLLPVKATSVVSDQGYWMTWLERWRQAKRHAQGIAELSYVLLSTWDALWNLPLSAYRYNFVARLGKVLTRLAFIHLLPLAQFFAMTVLTVYWLHNDRRVPMCPDRVWIAPLEHYQLLCGLAGAWSLTWPVVIPMVLITTANVLFIWVAFVRPAASGAASGASSRWHKEDAGVAPTCGSTFLTVVLLTCFDCVVCLGPLMLPYGLAVQVIAYINLFVFGNRVDYIPAAKATSLSGGATGNYGSMDNGKQQKATVVIVK